MILDNLQQMIRGLAAAIFCLEALPDGWKWSQDELDNLDDLRHEAIRLTAAIEAIFYVVTGHAHGDD